MLRKLAMLSMDIEEWYRFLDLVFKIAEWFLITYPFYFNIASINCFTSLKVWYIQEFWQSHEDVPASYLFRPLSSISKDHFDTNILVYTYKNTFSLIIPGHEFVVSEQLS